MKIKVIYGAKLDVVLDEKIRSAMESVGIKWYAQGKATDGYRDICFDYNPPSEDEEESQESTGLVEHIGAFFLSDCGKYIARHSGGGSFDIMTIDGSKSWLDNRNKDHNEFPEFANMFTGYSLIKENKSQSVWIFELSFADLDKSKLIDPYRGNCIVKQHLATFRRRIKFRTPKKISPKKE
ncbi:MAG TPA: hypothetical protein VMV56_07280 [Williamwhitmania sp.]|nr:hypothetical protein [Williamwhitmania sp.]